MHLAIDLYIKLFKQVETHLNTAETYVNPNITQHLSTNLCLC